MFPIIQLEIWAGSKGYFFNAKKGEKYSIFFFREWTLVGKYTGLLVTNIYGERSK